MSDLLLYHLEPPAQQMGEDTLRYMVGPFVEAVRKCLSDGGVNQKKEGVEEARATALIGYKGRLFYLFGDYQIGEPSAPYGAIGCGAPYALGSLSTMSWWSITPEQRIQKALEVAEEFSVGVRRPFAIMEAT